MDRRCGATLVEVLVVCAILAVLTGLLLPAVQSVRRTAALSESVNQYKQISIAYSGLLSIEPPPTQSGALLDKLQAHIEVREEITPKFNAIVFNYLNPHDPTFIRGDYRKPGNCSLAFNAQLMELSLRPDQIVDGSSDTIFFTERYARCSTIGVEWELNQVECYFNGVRSICTEHTPSRQATFADRYFNDVHPVTGPTPNTSTGSLGNLTFQVQVPEKECNGRTVQASFRNGLIVAFADGAVRPVAPNVSASTFWSAVTPNGNESLGDW
jgi:hypothetical protein